MCRRVHASVHPRWLQAATSHCTCITAGQSHAHVHVSHVKGKDTSTPCIGWPAIQMGAWKALNVWLCGRGESHDHCGGHGLCSGGRPCAAVPGPQSQWRLCWRYKCRHRWRKCPSHLFFGLNKPPQIAAPAISCVSTAQYVAATLC